MDRARALARTHVSIALLLLIIAACHGTPPRHPGEEYLSAIRFEGNRAIKDKDLREGLALHRVLSKGGSPDPYLVTVDRERVRGQYIRAGYLEVDVHSRVERTGDATTVIYTIDEGVRATTRVVINGLPKDPDLPVSKVRDVLKLDDGKPFSYEPYDKAKEMLLLVVEDAGYAKAKLDAHVVADRAHHEAVVELDYDVGPKCHFGRIDVIGASPELTQAVYDRLAFDTGDQFSASKMTESQRAIYDMRRFSTVQMLPDKGDGDTVNIKISLARSSAHELTLGAGFGIDPAMYEVRGRAGYSITGWPFPLTSLDIDTRPAYGVLRDGSGYEPRIRAMATLTRIDLFAPFITGTVAGGYNYLTYESWTSYGPRVRLGLESPLGIRQLRGRIGWSLENLDFRRITPLIDATLAHDLGLDRTERIGEFEQSAVLDLRDNPIEPTLGAYAEVRVNEGSKYAAGNLDFVQLTPEVRGYVPVPLTDWVLAARARYGTFYGDVPVSERYFSGGANTQRGFSERRLAPTVTGMPNGSFLAEPYGGGTMFETGIELRARLGTIRKMGVGGVLFLDGGDVTNERSELHLDNLHWAAGPGLRVFTPIGAVRLDFGYRLNRTGYMEPEPGSHYSFHLSIGEAY